MLCTLMAEKLDPKEIVTLEELAIFNTEVKYMKTHRPLPFGTKDSEWKKELEDTARQLTATTFKYFEAQAMTPEDIENYIKEMEKKVRRIKRGQGQRRGKLPREK